MATDVFRSTAIAAVGACALAMACSSSTSSSGPGKGIFGVGIAAGATPTTCTSEADDATCTACLKKSCCTASRACSNSAECSAVLKCADACADDACIQRCEKAHPSADTQLQALLDCAHKNCASCGGASPIDQCLPGAQDPTYCTAVPSKQTVKDCPNGSPSPDCVPSPTGSRTVFCCP